MSPEDESAMAVAKSPRVTLSGVTGGGGDDGGKRGGVDDADRRVGQRARHSGNAVASRRVGAHETLEADDDVRELRRRVEGPTPGTSGAPIHIYLC